MTADNRGGNKLKEIKMLLVKGIGGKHRENLGAEAKKLWGRGEKQSLFWVR